MTMRPPDPRDAVQRGQAIERYAQAWLEQQGLLPVARNQRFPGGELDLVMRDGDILVFVEVRHRRTTRHGSAAETITTTKQRRLIRAARFYLQHNGLSCPCRFDVLAITGAPPQLETEWLANAFEAN
ncbi:MULTISPECIES: YraN family protein [unclassified Halomonas]|uniref:YraN family protein n=1 Tax=unclassified Halomonas TaxID=2609666 RepID=UPI0021BD5693|nr:MULTISPECIES: YraN family protein [unclassified Halomonas]